MDIAVLSAGVIAFAIVLYVVLDGFDLGIGILFPLAPGAEARGEMMNSVAPLWDGNETWIVFGGAVLFAAFPAAYAVALSAFYLPIMLMLFALIFRGISFELRWKAERPRSWDAAFSAGSIVATLAQGLVLGGLLEGVTVRDRAFAGTSFDWVSLLGITAALGLLCGYALLGATWLIIKTTGELRRHAQRWAVAALIGVAFFMAAISALTPLQYETVRERWFAGSNFLYLAPLPLAAAALTIAILYGVRRGWERAPFFLAIALFLTGFAGIGVTLWPNLVPPSLSIWEAAAPRTSQIFVLIGAAVSLPMILIYTGYAYWVFRGKSGSGYAH